jgi:hypothetical protein
MEIPSGPDLTNAGGVDPRPMAASWMHRLTDLVQLALCAIIAICLAWVFSRSGYA